MVEIKAFILNNDCADASLKLFKTQVQKEYPNVTWKWEESKKGQLEDWGTLNQRVDCLFYCTHASLAGRPDLVNPWTGFEKAHCPKLRAGVVFCNASADFPLNEILKTFSVLKETPQNPHPHPVGVSLNTATMLDEIYKIVTDVLKSKGSASETAEKTETPAPKRRLIKKLPAQSPISDSVKEEEVKTTDSKTEEPTVPLSIEQKRKNFKARQAAKLAAKQNAQEPAQPPVTTTSESSSQPVETIQAQPANTPTETEEVQVLRKQLEESNALNEQLKKQVQELSAKKTGGLLSWMWGK